MRYPLTLMSQQNETRTLKLVLSNVQISVLVVHI